MSYGASDFFSSPACGGGVGEADGGGGDDATRHHFRKYRTGPLRPLRGRQKGLGPLLTLRKRGRGILGSLAVLLLAACGGPDLGAPEYPPESCARLEFIDAETGWNVVGAEDVEVDYRENLLYISAYDRILTEQALSTGDVPPTGAVYVVNFGDLQGPVLQVRPMLSVAQKFSEVRPHGIGLIRHRAKRLMIVNREYQTPDHGLEAWFVVAEDVDDPVAEHPDTITDSFRTRLPARTNDIAYHVYDAYFTVDQEKTGWFAQATGAVNGSLWKLDSLEPKMLLDGFAFANGLVTGADDSLIVAETRASELAVVDLEKNAVTRRIKLPGGPDNLTRAPDGSILAALHPSLFKLGLHRKFGAKHAPSRAVRVDPETGAWALLFDDPTGKVFTGATVAAEIDGKLVLGSATDRGLLVCERPQ